MLSLKGGILDQRRFRLSWPSDRRLDRPDGKGPFLLVAGKQDLTLSGGRIETSTPIQAVAYTRDLSCGNRGGEMG
jgi:hypothetical protein